MPKCSYCGKAYDAPRGLTLIMIDGNVKHLCSAKCRKNMEMKRRKVRWISKRKESKQELLEEIREEAAEEVAEKVLEVEEKKEEKSEKKEKPKEEKKEKSEKKD